jgi:predicted Rdx family selenoprotein
VRRAVERLPNVELRVVRAGPEGAERDGTHLFAALDRALQDLPGRRLAGVVMITDGQVHDVPDAAATGALPGPLHVMITGEKGEGDRRLTIVQAPNYGLVGKPLEMTVRVDDLPQQGGGQARLSVLRDGERWREMMVPVGRDTVLEFQLDHAGPTYFELEVDAGPRELTLLNNRAVAAVSGVRDRLRVLLISGEPHPGERAWRNLLKSDPGVDLVHFTILRPPDKQDLTPVKELSLISFPVRELFEIKLDEFDLIIFDRYRRRGILTSTYLENIARYVREGGALLVADGPFYAGSQSLYHTPLGEVLPGEPTGQSLTEPFRAKVTDVGKRHPVTAALPGIGGDHPWGRWFRQIEVAPKGGQVLMTGIDDRPLLILDRTGEGRVAQIMSDQIWLWGRGYDGGGPQAELLRRVAHWLMKEPELEENDLKAEIHGGRLEITRRSLEPNDSPIKVVSPSGKETSVQPTETAPGRATATLPVDEIGLYRISDARHSTLAASGALNPIEMADVRATDERLMPVVAKTGGGVSWLSDQPLPEFREVRPGRTMAGRNRLSDQSWFGLRINGDYVVTGIREIPLLPGLLVLVAALGLLVAAWRRESK